MKSKKNEIKAKSKKIINSFKYAIQGILTSFKTERNMKIHNDFSYYSGNFIQNK